jgi:hypothetical protein
MVLYWLPVFHFPYAGYGLIVDDHIIFIAAFLVLISFHAGKYFGIDELLGEK